MTLEKRIHEYFGYVEDWVVIPLDDQRHRYWRLDQSADGRGCVTYADSLEELQTQEGNCYQDDIYTQRFLPKWVYPGAEFTMVCCDPHVDGNKFLRIFDNTKKVE